MKHFIISLVAIVFTLGFFIPEAEARRFGGGGSFGMQRQMSPPQAPRPAAQAPAPRAGQQAAPNRSWMGPVAGLAAGLGLAALFSHLGMGEEFGSLLLIGLMIFAAVMLFRMLSRRAMANADGANRMQYAGSAAGGGASDVPQSPKPSFGGLSAAPVGQPINTLRADFDEEGFVRQAKLNFIRLQAANDKGDLADIREFTTPEVFAEIRMQMADTPVDSPQHTDVVDLAAEVLEVAEEDDRYVVSVRFHGLLREEVEAAPEAFDEIWHLIKDKEGARGWLIAGIQQGA